MKEIKTVAVMGSGAVGSYFIWGLSEKLGENFWVIADGERRERYERDGIYINDKRFPLHLRTPKEAKGVDLLLIAMKYDALLYSLEEIKEIADDHTIVMTLLNGVDSEAIVGCPVGAFAVSEHMANLRWRLRDEVCRVAAALGIDISELSEIEKAKCPSLPSSKYSTLQDLETGRHTEIEMFAGTLIRIGKQYHVAMPFCEFAYETIKALEEKNDGLYSEWSELLK